VKQLIAACCLVACSLSARAQTEGLEEIVVTATFREQSVAELPLSVTVLDPAELQVGGAQHFEEVIREVPNLNLSGEGSRARYYQLRGIGELEQYDGAPNPSIGFIVDDIDFSGLGSIGTLFDIGRVEVLRGPQGTRYGANALGGLIYLRSTEPTDKLAADVEATAGSDEAAGLGAAVGGPIGRNLGGRASVYRFRSDGFRHNAYLNRDDTYGRDELSAHGKLHWTPSDRLDVDFAGLYVDVDNGYDAWAVDNGFTTYSDKPGRDAQSSTAASVRVHARFDRFDLVSISGAANTDATFSFDADWGNPQYWAPYVYDYVTTNQRERRTYNQEVRFLSKPGAIAGGRGDWLAGVYALDLTESNDHLDAGIYDDGTDCTPCTLDSPVTSRYGATNLAAFGQVDIGLGDRLDFVAGLRWEQRDASYTDTAGNRFDPVDDMLGGELALTWRLADRRSAYLRLARGYKAGGFNIALAGVDFGQVDTLRPDQIEFDPETLTSLEGGYRVTTHDDRLRADIAAFVTRRHNQQIKIPLQLTLGDPSSFLLLTFNAERSEHHGLEAQLDWQPNQRIEVTSAVGILRTDIQQFALYPALEGREEAHAPHYTYSIGVDYRAPSGWWGRAGVSGMDGFYFDYSHDERSNAYGLLDLSAGRDVGPWEISVWVRNALDERYAVRGFYFGDRPPDFPNERYIRLGDPRHYGVTVRYKR
jgi:iron complex outermembrane recepter protein